MMTSCDLVEQVFQTENQSPVVTHPIADHHIDAVEVLNLAMFGCADEVSKHSKGSANSSGIR
jgi:hypothetical protein